MIFRSLIVRFTLPLCMPLLCQAQFRSGNDTLHATAIAAAASAPQRMPLIEQPADMRWASYTRVTLDGHIPSTVTHIRTAPLLTTAAIYGTAVIGLHIYQANAWWRKDRGPFHFQEDWPENLQNDKFGHFFGAYLISYGNREALLEAGLSGEAAHDWGALLGGLYQLYVESEDGYATTWGFSPTDAYADLAGAGYFFAQYYIPILQNFHEKWCYDPSQFLGTGSIPGQQRTVFDDYQGQSYWWAVDVWNLLPASAQQWYPKWLQFAVGYIAKKYSPYIPGVSTDLPDTREIYIGLDYQLIHLLPKTDIPFLAWLIQSLDNFHFPAPALRLAPNVKFSLLYPIQIKIGNLSF